MYKDRQPKQPRLTLKEALLALSLIATPAQADGVDSGTRSLYGGTSTMEMGADVLDPNSQKRVALPENLQEWIHPIEEIRTSLEEEVREYSEAIYAIDVLLEYEEPIFTERVEDNHISKEEVEEYVNSLDDITDVRRELRATANDLILLINQGESRSSISEGLNQYYASRGALLDANAYIAEERVRLLGEEHNY